MASLDISHEIGRSYRGLVNSPPANKSSPSYAQWAVFTVSTPLVNAFVASSASKASVLKVHTTAEGELQDLIEEFSDGKVQFAFLKVKDANTGLAKFVLIAWCGEGVPERVKGYFTGHLNAVSRVLHGYHVQITARSESDLSPESILHRVADASGAKYSAGSSTFSPLPPAPKPTVSAYKPAYQPTKVSGGPPNPVSSRSPYKRGESTDADGWGADAPPVTRSQLEKVPSAYTATKVDIAAIRAQPTSTTSGSGFGGNPDVVKGGYQPIGKVDIAALRALGQQQDRPDIVKGSYEPIGKVDIAAIRAQAHPRPSANSPGPRSSAPAQEEQPLKSLTERSAAFSQGERLTSLLKPKPAKKFGAGAPAFGTKPPTPGAFGTTPAAPGAPAIGAASRDFGSSGGKTPAQLWAEKKARERGASGASETTSPTVSPGYTGQHRFPLGTSTTGRSGGSSDEIAAKLSQQRINSSPPLEEEVQTPAGGIGALRSKFAGAPPMGTPSSPKSPRRTGGMGGFHHAEREVLPPPPIDISSRPPPAPVLAIPPPPQPGSPSPPSPEAPGSPVRIAIPVARQPDSPPVAQHEPEPHTAIPAEGLARVVPDERELQMEPTRDRGASAETSVGDEGAGGKRAVVLYDYDAAEENEIGLVEGQVVGEIDMVDEDWWAGRNAAGEHGLFPSNFVELLEDTEVTRSPPRAPAGSLEPDHQSSQPQGQGSSDVAVALYDYEAAEENELSFPEDAIIEDLEFPDEDWWLGTYKGNRGLFPANYVERRQ
ncbi:hypothetical protein C7212DRAFT_355347 [Tuber magnatum]|uniref:Actin binding protein n=1 Tax=Tuber magnatum TaxID=42249 RepID=A0A317SXV3_9PEZI|nr:hypothetical protein C7212DRAFT_355347 [Tuber magnatum]